MLYPKHKLYSLAYHNQIDKKDYQNNNGNHFYLVPMSLDKKWQQPVVSIIHCYLEK